MNEQPVIAISGTEFREEPIDAILRVASDLDVSAVELWSPENFSAAGDGKTKQRLRRWGGRVAAVSCGVEVGETHDVTGTARRLTEAVDLAAELGAGLVNTYFGAPGYRDDRRAAEVFLRNLDGPLRRAEAAGITIVVENEFNAFGRDDVAGDLTRRPSALLELLTRAGSASLKLNFDAANFYCAGVEPYPYAFSVLSEHVRYLHVKDVRLVDPAQADASDLPWLRFRDYDACYATTALGSGAVNWPGLLDRLVADGYSGALTLEPHAAPGHRNAAFAQAVSWLRAHLAAGGTSGATGGGSCRRP